MDQGCILIGVKHDCLFYFSGIYKDQIPLHTSPLETSSPSLSRANRETRHIGRTLLWKTSTEALEAKLRGNLPNPSMCPLLVNQSESIRLDNQLRGWFRLDPGPVSNITDIDDQPGDNTINSNMKDEKLTTLSDSPGSNGNPASSGNTALDHYTKPAVHSLTGSIYHMLVADRELRASKFG